MCSLMRTHFGEASLQCPVHFFNFSFSCCSAGAHVYNPHLLDNRSTSSSVCKAGALVPPSSCLDGGLHGWVPVDTHSTPVLTSVRRLWVAYVVQEPNTPQEHAQPVHGSGARVQDHDPETNQPASQYSSGTIGTGHGCCRADTETVSSPVQQSSRSPPVFCTPREQRLAAPVSNNNKVLKRCWRMPRWLHPLVRRTQQPSRRATRLVLKTHWWTLWRTPRSPKSSVQCFAHLTRLRTAEMKEFDTIARLETQVINENNETF